MEYILVFMIGMSVGIILMAITMKAETSELLEERFNAENRAVTHFRKLFRIEQILRKAEIDKTPSVLVVDKIKEVISSDQTNQ